MKIIFLAPFGIRPKGTVIARMLPLAVELQALGHEVVIVAPPYTNPEDSGFSEILSGVRLVNITLPNTGKVLGTLPMAWRMFRTALVEKPDLVHLFKPKGYGGLAAMLLLNLRHFGFRLPPLLVDTDDWEGEGGMNELHSYSLAEKRLFAFQERWLSRHAAGVTVASLELGRLTAAFGVTQEHIFYFPNCVDSLPLSDGLRIRGQLGIRADAPVILLYTRFFEFSQEKLHYLFAEIYRRVPGVRFLVVGKGRHGEEKQLVAAARELGFQDALIIAGWVEPTELPEYLAVGDVAIYPFADTLVNRSKCPAKFTELVRAGLPVVADRVGQIPEYVAPELHGLLCDPDNWEEMATKCMELLHDRELNKKTATVGRDYILETYAWRGYANKLHGFYRECVSQ